MCLLVLLMSKVIKNDAIMRVFANSTLGDAV